VVQDNARLGALSSFRFVSVTSILLGSAHSSISDNGSNCFIS
jgi:hypothetical protein